MKHQLPKSLLRLLIDIAACLQKFLLHAIEKQSPSMSNNQVVPERLRIAARRVRETLKISRTQNIEQEMTHTRSQRGNGLFNVFTDRSDRVEGQMF